MILIRDLYPGELGLVVGFVTGDCDYRQHLLAMGLTPGVEFKLVRIAPLGDPVELRVRGTLLSLRKSEADMLIIERQQNDSRGQQDTLSPKKVLHCW